MTEARGRRVVVVGAGAVGSVVGGHLHDAGVPVTMVAREAHKSAIDRYGLRLLHDDGEVLTFRPPTVTSVADAEITSEDIVILACKSFDTRAALLEVHENCANPRSVVSYQNGVRNEELAAGLFDAVIGAVPMLSGRLCRPGVVHNPNGPGYTIVGGYQGADAERMAEVEQLFTAAGFGVKMTDDILAAKWSKLIINCGNALFAITNVPTLDRSHDPALIELSNTIVAEAEETLRKAGISYSLIRDYLPAPADGAPAVAPEPPSGVHFFTSSWNDMVRRRGEHYCEAPWFNGEIAELAQKHSIQVPVHQTVLEISLEMARSQRRPGRFTPEELLAVAKGAAH